MVPDSSIKAAVDHYARKVWLVDLAFERSHAVDNEDAVDSGTGVEVDQARHSSVVVLTQWCDYFIMLSRGRTGGKQGGKCQIFQIHSHTQKSRDRSKPRP